ncbi:MAG: chromosome segregation protein SMC [Bacillota bacterium]
MYLKQIDLQGFKSFPEKIKLEFTPGVTAVVGPNGSGKSNISDAIRWVLGEQRAKNLRGDKMEDVIFIGTETRKALGFAEVAITIDNQDEKLPIEYTEVKIARRVFRSGESEYRINGTQCRLKDVQELFMDTGIGREGYSIISQGQIDRMLNAKGEERRKIFEEATGIVKYKMRRQDSLNKLEKEQQNLIRVNDIITELELQLEPLKKQSEVAKEYLELRELLKRAEVISYSEALVQHDLDMAENEDKQRNCQEDVQIWETDIASIKTMSSEQQTTLGAVEDSIQQTNEEITTLSTERERKTGEVKLKEQEENHTLSDKNRILQDISLKNEKMESTLNSKKVLEQRAFLAKTEQDEKNNILQEKESAYDTLNQTLSSGESRFENFRNQIFDQHQQTTVMKGNISKNEAVLEQFDQKMEQLKDSGVVLEARKHQQEIHQQVIDKNIETAMAEVQEIMQESASLEQEKNDLEIQKDESTQKLIEADQLSVSTASRIKLLEEMEQANEGFVYSVKNLLNMKNRQNQGILGALGQLVQTDSRYETAMEVALGGAIQNVVTETAEDAKRAIMLLKERKWGTATFLPISTVKGKEIPDNLPIFKENGVLGLASKFVTHDPKYANIVKSLLGRTLLVESPDIAISIGKKYDQQYRMVTVGGELFHVGGAMTGGSRKNNALHILGRASEIESLKKELQSHTQEMEHWKSIQTNWKTTLAELDENLSLQKTKQQQKELELARLKHEKSQAISDVEQLQEQLILCEEEQVQCQQDKERIEKEIVSFEKALLDSETLVQSINEELSQTQESLSTEKDQLGKMLEEITALRVELSGIDRDLEHMQQDILRLSDEYEILSEEKDDLIEDSVALEMERKEKQEEQQQLIEEAKVLESQMEELKASLEQLLEKREVCKKEIDKINEQLEEKRATGLLLQQELTRFQIQQEKMLENQQRMVNALWSEYELTPRMAQEYFGEGVVAPEETPQELRVKLKSLGEVNVGALDQYKEVNERFTFLSQQRSDILEGEAKLRGIIDELSQLMETQFREQFAAISENFSLVFKEMFGGGTGHLQLVEGESILESNIEIIARPPGKNLQNMQLLSGGERALTAISILFGILRMKPSPFCVLDEIEAALDDSNVVRYGKYLKKFSEHTQFIVITHRKGTMEYSDRLYGVTMEEKGVSKLVSVDFTEEA